MNTDGGPAFPVPDTHHPDGQGMSWASCEVENRIIAAGGSTRAAAIRALRAKVEGGGQ